ncbi:MAG: M48 family metalloprotease [Anderseniella sp.]
MTRRSTLQIALMLAAGLAANGCAENHLLAQLDAGVSGASVNGERKLPDVSVSPAGTSNFKRQQIIGNDLAQRALGVMKRSNDTELEDYLNAIVTRLKTSPEHGASGLFYKVYLVDSPHANAFTPGGGHIFVTTGIVTKLRTEGQMAMVLAHEMAHNRASHVVKGHDGQSLNKRVTAFGKRIFDDGLGVPWLSSGVKALADTSLSSYTRAQEEEADMLGFRYFVSAGYDPHEAPRSFAALITVDAQKKSIFDVFDGYPEGIRRAEEMNAMVHAAYRDVDTSHLRRNTKTYVELGSAYWQ